METNDIAKLEAFIRKKGCCRIGVDGIDGAGKSTMAIKLSERLGISCLNIDYYLDKDKGGFLDNLKYDELKQQTLDTKCFVIEGVCLLNVLEKTGISIDCLVYVKRMCHSIWADEHECEVTEELEEFINHEKEITRLIEQTESVPETLGLAEEIIRYHYKYKPHKKADLFYTREDC